MRLPDLVVVATALGIICFDVLVVIWLSFYMLAHLATKDADSLSVLSMHY